MVKKGLQHSPHPEKTDPFALYQLPKMHVKRARERSCLNGNQKGRTRPRVQVNASSLAPVEPCSHSAPRLPPTPLSLKRVDRAPRARLPPILDQSIAPVGYPDFALCCSGSHSARAHSP